MRKFRINILRKILALKISFFEMRYGEIIVCLFNGFYWLELITFRGNLEKYIQGESFNSVGVIKNFLSMTDNENFELNELKFVVSLKFGKWKGSDGWE